MHDYHDELPGFDRGQILVDGCAECEHRAESVARVLGHLDHKQFLRAWGRAIAWQKAGRVRVSLAEAPTLDALWGVMIHLERLGVPIGLLPVGASRLDLEREGLVCGLRRVDLERLDEATS